MQPLSLHDWSDHLRALAGRALRATPLMSEHGGHDDIHGFIDSFSDEHGDRRAVDRPLLARMLGVDPGSTPRLADSQIDLRIWWALHDATPVESVVTPAPGPLIGERAFETGTIETATETELAALHAFSHHADCDGRLLERCFEAARWHVAMLQPDNGTNHPWAVHVFVRLACAEPDPAAASAARLHAETLLHNSLVTSGGRPDRFSACLLLDAARSLE